MFYFSTVAFFVLLWLYLSRLRKKTVAARPDVLSPDAAEQEKLNIKKAIIADAVFGVVIGCGIIFMYFVYGLIIDYRNSQGIFYPDSLLSSDKLPPALSDVAPPAPKK